MPIIESAKKQLRASAKKRIFNQRRKKAVDDVIKEFKKLVSEKKIAEAKALLPKIQKALDKAVKTNYIKQNNASRRKSRIVAMVKKVS